MSPSMTGNTGGQRHVRLGIAPGAGSGVASGLTSGVEFSVASLVIICFAAEYASVSV